MPTFQDTITKYGMEVTEQSNQHGTNDKTKGLTGEINSKKAVWITSCILCSLVDVDVVCFKNC